ncbi:UTP--glucose-1-phosphate uridylyltransferase [Fructilactobacillus lindneri]|uniref:UTP--glucose-1-phosphate uridylyltransferase n=2 Tax=Fructilactobacillus lindneri TaxID=53444 RepID=A0A0R2JXW8_9LACO|nr:UTP--glucose-1-phosphate uridylyltransferase GalU [Fructilactobacillus lindneri]ANZ58457.1 UTP--glucose-1-phosphate uridylyltransferase [Fructilactobacillus lindneri]ANZ59767.1 UTP--glucose-1-phosphate uridylyltransferase [Fructilactobacillus lindneri]KRN79287.1 UTP-glucose-1-phosphate uridylyltransferase [Fructilactobacillus lindneri DSM 20690 = JCM 11027]POG98439.1 UTP--glucose-1-phosphate uridylyltransferase [Fructilactobacillus lindneri]POH03838.1 UTP--glucose-1-phosphate uridylyltransf
MKKVTKAIIPAAGLGTRFLPETKAMPKEMLPIVDTPTIQYIVEEAKASGITDLVIVIGKGKRAIEDHFSPNYMLEENLKKKHKEKMLEEVEKTNEMNIYFIRQAYPDGLGDAVLTAKSFIGNDPFVVMLGDDLMQDKVPLTKQLIESYQDSGASTLAVMKVPHEETSKYGVIDPLDEVKPGLYDVKTFVEKPNPEDAPSDLAIIGRYLFTPEIFEVLENTKPGKGNEVQLTDAIDTLNKKQRVFAHEFKGKRFDTGNKLSWLETNIEYGINHPEIKGEFREYLKKIGKRLEKEDQ